MNTIQQQDRLSVSGGSEEAVCSYSARESVLQVFHLLVDQKDNDAAETRVPELICTEVDCQKQGSVLMPDLPSEGSLDADGQEEQANEAPALDELATITAFEEKAIREDYGANKERETPKLTQGEAGDEERSPENDLDGAQSTPLDDFDSTAATSASEEQSRARELGLPSEDSIVADGDEEQANGAPAIPQVPAEQKDKETAETRAPESCCAEVDHLSPQSGNQVDFTSKAESTKTQEGCLTRLKNGISLPGRLKNGFHSQADSKNEISLPGRLKKWEFTPRQTQKWDFTPMQTQKWDFTPRRTQKRSGCETSRHLLGRHINKCVGGSGPRS